MQKVLLIRVGLSLAVGLVIMAATARWLAPAETNSAEMRYMQCDSCRLELVYNKSLAGGRCPKCQPPKSGTLIATRDSVANGAANPRRAMYLALSFEGVFLLGLVVFILYHPPRERNAMYFYITCRNCRRRLRYLAKRAGAAGWCPRCKAMFAYPLESEEPGPDDEYGGY